MKIWFNSVIDRDRRLLDIKKSRIRIGRAAGNEIVLSSPYVAEEAAVLYQRGEAWELVVLGINGLTVGERQLYGGDRLEIRSNVAIEIFPFSLTLDLPRKEEISADQRRTQLDNELSRIMREIHLELLQRMDLETDVRDPRRNSDEYLLTIEKNLDAIALGQDVLAAADGEMTTHLAGRAVRGQLLDTLAQGDTAARQSQLLTDRHWSRLVSSVPDRERELEQTVKYLLKNLVANPAAEISEQITAAETGFWPAWQKVRPGLHQEFQRYLALRQLKSEIKDIVFGFGPLEDLLRLPTVSEIMVVDRDRIFVERFGRMESSGRRFISDAVVLAIIERIVSRVGRRIDKARPLVDARLPDGSRVNAVIPPLAVSGPCITIRKFPLKKLLIDDLVAKKALTRNVAEFLRALVLARKNILISGGTGSGKTTLLNCLSDFIPNRERIVTVEDTAELQLQKEHVVRLETKDANVEGAGEYTIRDLVKNALRMRPDRIVVGECRGAEALDMLQAMNTGHDGSMSTVHANTTGDAVLRLEVLVQMAADLPVSSIHQQIVSAVDVIVQLSRLRSGRRCVTQISEVLRVDPERSRIELRDLFLMEGHDDETELAATGSLPTFMGELIEREFLDLEAFYH